MKGIPPMKFISFVFLVVMLAAPSLLKAESPPSSLVSAVKSYLKEPGEGAELTFQHALTDLNSDGQVDAIVLLTGSAWCGSGGCTMLVFEGNKDSFVFRSRSTIIRKPIKVTAEKRNSWKTLIVSTNKIGDVVMRFNGTGYPLNPSIQPKASTAQLKAAEILLK